jgi:predicted ATPase
MVDDRWRRVCSLFGAVVESAAAGRAALLDAAVDPELRREVESLLAAHEGAGSLDRLAAQLDGMRRAALASRDGSVASAGGRAAPAALAPGRRLGRHEIRSRLGAGGMGEVYRAFDTRLQREVAIKILGQSVRLRSGALQRFEQEARAASALNHPNIVTVYDIGEESAAPYIVMELVEGASLRQMLSRPWPLDLLLHVAAQLADGLVAAHERRIVHGDLKPENVLVSRHGIAKILDFGLAHFRVAEALPDAAAPRPGALLGTPGYLAPEIVRGYAADERADQFSLGAILFEMATGERAFPGATALDALEFTVRAEPRPLEGARSDLPSAFALAVARCLRKDPTARHASTREVLDALHAARRSAQTQRRGAARAGRAASLPPQRTRLVGRRLELEEIDRLVVGRQVRLLTLTGPGGIGKTRLAVEAAQALAPRFGGGVFFVPLASLRDARLVATAIAQAVGVAVTPARPALASVAGDLRDAAAPTLLVLDNFEQVIDAAGDVSELLAACPELTVIVTSREVLHLYGEHGLPVAPLELPERGRLPSPERMAEVPAVALFVERARAANPAFGCTAENAVAVAGLCAGLDGLPLALELAAAHARVLSPEAMLVRLEHRLGLLTCGARDLPGRHQTLRRTLDWSHQLLSATEQAIFRRLSVFEGSFTLEAAQAVADPHGTLSGAVEDGVRALVDKSLLQPREPPDGERRFAMLATIREYALEKLAERGEADVARKAHAAYFLVLAEEGSVALGSGEHPGWFARFEAEHDDFRAALDWLTRKGHAEWGLRLAFGMFHFWERGEHLAEGRRRLAALLDLPGAREFPAERARALFAAGVLASDQLDFEEGIALHGRCLRIHRERGDRWGVGVVLVALGNQCVCRGDYERARSYLEESLELWRELGEDAGYARSLSNLAFVARSQGRLEESRQLYQHAASLFEALRDRLSRAWTMDHEGDVARDQGQLDAAGELYRSALDTFRSLDHGWGVASTLADLGAVARQRGDRAAAGRLHRESLASFLRLGHRRGIARQLESLACLAAEEGQGERGIRLAAAAAALRERVGAPPSPAVQVELERALAALQRLLGPERARATWREGAALPLEDAARLAASGEEAYGVAAR